jgi:hypothetical protein
LKLPDNARGALSLGISLQKDQLIQAAMRLRQLGTTQSVTFVAPPEVHQSILDLRKLGPNDQVSSKDIIHWLLDSTCQGLESLFPLYDSMCKDFVERTQAALDNPDFLHDCDQRDSYLEVLQQKEKRNLKQLYEPKPQSRMKRCDLDVKFVPQLGEFMKELKRRRKAFQDSGNAVHASALQEVEQEREVEIEVAVEQVRQLQRPPSYTPHRFERLHPDIINFVKSGKLVARSAGYEQSFEALTRSAVGMKHGISKEATKSLIFSTMEFSKTVIVPAGKPHDSYQVIFALDK